MKKTFYALALLIVGCGESESERLDREAAEEIQHNIEQFEADSTKNARINKAMSTGLDRTQAEKQVNAVYKY